MTAEESVQAMFDGIDRDREQQFVHSVEDFYAGAVLRVPPADYGLIYLRLEKGAGSLKGIL